MRELDEITGLIVDTAVRMHVDLGPGLLEAVYEPVIARSLERRGLHVARQVPVDFDYDGMTFARGFRVDLPSAAPRDPIPPRLRVTRWRGVYTDHVMRHLTLGWLMAAGLMSMSLIAQGQTPPVPVPKPFPGATPTAPREKPTTSPPPAPTTTTTTTPATTDAARAAPSPLDPLLAGIAIYPAAELLESYDAGQGQRYFIFGTPAPFLDVVTYYKTALKNGGRELFKTPGMQQFDLGRYQEQSMAYPPSVLVKDYVWNGSTGYLHVKGRAEKRYPTIIQIVPR